ncbi:unnamed protein product [Nippostrongylus brasiliensis]|uniref:Secreted protein n=1 Tax=Nippostrongylus brasiliensis TaxID=27835 RepID=A0A0N4XT91_NIPBR|nr:unnamed protein product [Nippostrongylus brasiliensis]
MLLLTLAACFVVILGKEGKTPLKTKKYKCLEIADDMDIQLVPKSVKHYANSYGVTDVLSWVGRNCSFAKMFLPTATCDEINTLVASCYKNKNT